MHKKIKYTILDKLFWTFSHCCTFCLVKAGKRLNDDGQQSKFDFWINLAEWFNEIEKRIYFMQYGKAL